jgi:hypothetical protein
MLVREKMLVELIADLEIVNRQNLKTIQGHAKTSDEWRNKYFKLRDVVLPEKEKEILSLKMKV